ncbi:MAG: hypothetical protein ACOX7K_08555 [Oscillospiraceae bacterium]|jgi:hypothetical protein
MGHNHEKCAEEYVQDHSHTHSNGQTHSHPHEHAPGIVMDNPKEFLEYMIHHNEHHTENLSELSGKLTSDAQEKVRSSIRMMETANGQLAEALKFLKS